MPGLSLPTLPWIKDSNVLNLVIASTIEGGLIHLIFVEVLLAIKFVCHEKGFVGEQTFLQMEWLCLPPTPSLTVGMALFTPNSLFTDGMALLTPISRFYRWNGLAYPHLQVFQMEWSCLPPSPGFTDGMFLFTPISMFYRWNGLAYPHLQVLQMEWPCLPPSSGFTVGMTLIAPTQGFRSCVGLQGNMVR